MSFNAFLLSGFSLLPQSSVAFPSGNVSGVWDTSRHQDEKSAGGFEPMDEAVFTCKTSLVADPKGQIGTVVTRGGDSWRILRVRTGDIFSHFTLVSSDKA